MMFGDDMTGAGWLWMAIGLVGLVLAILAGAWLIARSRQGNPPGPPTPLEILQQRFARGEIDKEAFESARQALRQP